MASVKLSTIGKLIPFRQIQEQDKINLYALNTTGELGTFVALDTGNANFDSQHGWNFDATPGASYDRIHSYRYGVNTKVRPVQSGDSKFTTIGVTLANVVEFDENEEKYLNYPQKKDENHAVLSGQAVPILTKGIIGITHKAYTTGVRIPVPGDLFGPSRTVAGRVDFFPQSALTDTGVNGRSETEVLGKCIGTGSKFGGYAFVSLG